MLVVTSGAAYIDIDAYASAIAYAELLNLRGKNAVAASSSPWNESITTSLRALKAPLKTDYQPADADEFILVDVSDPDRFDKFVGLDNVIEVFDHHPGFENYWQDKIRDNTHIEFVGAAATLIFEQWQKEELAHMSSTSARLLAAGILDNTLCFNAMITTQRDKDAYDYVASRAHLTFDFAASYFSETQAAVMSDLTKALINDTKHIAFHGRNDNLCVGQLVVWNVDNIITENRRTITKIMNGVSDRWFVNIVSIAEGRSYFLTGNPEVKTWLADLLHLEFHGNQAMADRLWLRKEIMKAALQITA